jgi:hypothetical protein
MKLANHNSRYQELLKVASEASESGWKLDYSDGNPGEQAVSIQKKIVGKGVICYCIYPDGTVSTPETLHDETIEPAIMTAKELVAQLARH